MPLPSRAGLAAPGMSGPALLEAMPPFFFQNALECARKKAKHLAKKRAYATQDVMIAKLAAASVEFLHNLGYVRACDLLLDER